MSQLKKVFARIQQSKQEQKKIKKMYRDSLDSSAEYKKTIEEIKTLKERKKKIEEALKEDYSAEFSRLDTIKLDLRHDNEMLSDLALNSLVKGESISLEDEDGNQYAPSFKVSFKKAK